MQLKVGVVVVALLAAFAAGCGGGSSTSAAGSNSVITSPANGSTLPNATIGAVYTQTISVISGGTAPYTFIPTGTPPGLTFTTLNTFSGTLSGTPTQAGQGTFALQVIDGNSQVTQLSYVLTVTDASGSTLTISPATLPNGTTGAAFSQSLAVSSGTAPYSWNLSSGTVPTGLTFATGATNGTITLSGIPTVAGTYTFTVTVSDSSATVQQGTRTYTVTIS